MTQTPVKPAGTIIEEIEGLEGRTYRWNPYPGKISRWLLAIFLFIWMIGWGIALVTNLYSVMGITNGADRDFMLRWLAIWIFFGALVGTFLYLLVRPVKYECIALGQDCFRYDPGSFPFGMLINPVYLLRRRSPVFPLNLLIRPRKQIELNKQDVGSFSLKRVREWVGERQRLCFDHGADRIEIGENLREPEREWLAAVIQNWQDG